MSQSPRDRFVAEALGAAVQFTNAISFALVAAFDNWEDAFDALTEIAAADSAQGWVIKSWFAYNLRTPYSHEGIREALAEDWDALFGPTDAEEAEEPQ